MSDSGRPARPDYLTPPVKQPDSEQIAEAQRLWLQLRATPHELRLHNEFCAWCLHNNLLKLAIRNYGELIDDPQFDFDARRLARLQRERLIKVMIIPTHVESTVDKSNMIWLGLILPGMLGLLFGLLLLFQASGLWRMFGAALSVLSLLIVGGYLAYRSGVVRYFRRDRD